MKKLLSVILAVVMTVSVFAAPVAFAAYEPANQGSVSDESHSESAFTKTFYNFTDKLVEVLVGVINIMIPAPYSWGRADKHVTENIMTGDDTFLDSPADGAKWSLGYANASLLEGQDVLDGKHFVGGSITVTKKTATEVWDDLKVRTIALDDGSGRGTVVIAVLDAFGLPNCDVKLMRSELADYFEANNVKSFNVACLHQHSAVDTLGLNGSISSVLFVNPFLKLVGKNMKSGRNDGYMRNLYDVVEASVKSAVEDMTEGTLYYGKADISPYMTDKRDPQVLDNYSERFRFVPDDGTEETWLASSCIHCVGNGAGQREVTGDYPYYMEKYINETYGANFALILGAEQGTSQDKSTTNAEGMTTVEELDAFGTKLAQILNDISDETEVEPILNYAGKEVQFDVSNCILLFAGKVGLFPNEIVRTGLNKFSVISEIGYMEIGADIAVPIIPGEAAGEMLYGGYCTAENSWTGKDFDATTISELVGDKEIVALGVCNDMIGYIIPDNDYMPLLYPNNKSLEVVALGNRTCSAVLSEFEELINSK